MGAFSYRDTGRSLRLEAGDRAATLRVLAIEGRPPGTVGRWAAELAADAAAAPVLVTDTKRVPAEDGMDLITAAMPTSDLLLSAEVLDAGLPAGPGRAELRACDAGGGAGVPLPADGPTFFVEGLRRSGGLRLCAGPGHDDLTGAGLEVRLTCGFISNAAFETVEFAPCVSDGVRWSDLEGAEGPVDDPNVVLRLQQDE